MALFTIRVELHNATRDDYTKLHKLLAARGITDIVTSDTGQSYRLPPAEYNYQGDASATAVTQTVKGIADQVVRSSAVLVTKVAERSWIGLELLGKGLLSQAYR